MKLYELAHSRAGDKGDTSILSLIAYHESSYALLRDEVTAERVAAHFAGLVRGQVERYALPHLNALQFVCHGALAGGVTTSLGSDSHGKSLSSALLELEVTGPAAQGTP